MKIYLHSDNAERQAKYPVTIAPAADKLFVKPTECPKSWMQADGTPINFEINFAYGVADVDDEIGHYMVKRGIAHGSRMLRKIYQLFNRNGEPIEEVFDRDRNRIFLDAQAA
jgi:hypothetical protein